MRTEALDALDMFDDGLKELIEEHLLAADVTPNELNEFYAPYKNSTDQDVLDIRLRKVIKEY
ncbi:hypothetical protein ES705_13538 [subsurface metagenome]